MPRSVPEPVRPSTANVSATGVMPSPTTETVCARNTLRKSRARSRPVPSLKRPGMRRLGDMPGVYPASVGLAPRRPTLVRRGTRAARTARFLPVP
jgi:hypothetical protein